MNSGSPNKNYSFFNTTSNNSPGSWTSSGLKSSQNGHLPSHSSAHGMERKHSLNYENFGQFQRHFLNGYSHQSTLSASISSHISETLKNPDLANRYDMSESGSGLINQFNAEENRSRDIESASPPMSFHAHSPYRNEYLKRKSLDLNALRAIYERNQAQYSNSESPDALFHINQQPHHHQSNIYRNASNQGLQQTDLNNNHSPNLRANLDEISSAAMLAAHRANMMARNNASMSSQFSPPMQSQHAFEEKSSSSASLGKSVSSSPSSSFSVSSDSLNLNSQFPSAPSSFNSRIGSYLMENPHLQNKHRPLGAHLLNSKGSPLPDISELGKLGSYRVNEYSSALVDHHLKNLMSNSVSQGLNDKMYKDSLLKPGFGGFQSNINKRPKSTFPFGKCKVCSDKATGVHYGIATCEGCKGFFKRSTLRKEKYRCFFGNNCPLTPDNRNRCKSCRFRKCLEVGMSIQGVKMGRIPKAEKEKALMILKYKSGVEDGEGAEGMKNDEQYNYDEISETSSTSQANENANMMEDVEDDYDDDKKSPYNAEEYDSDDMCTNGPSEVPSGESGKQDQKLAKEPRSEQYNIKKQIIYNFTHEKDKQKSAMGDEETKQTGTYEESSAGKPIKKTECTSSSSSLTSPSSSGSSSPLSDQCASYDSLDKLATNPTQFESSSVTEYIDLITKSSKIEIKESSVMNLASILAKKKYQEQQKLQNDEDDDDDPEITIKKTRTEINRPSSRQTTETPDKNQIAPEQPQSPSDTESLSKQPAETAEDDQADKQTSLMFKSGTAKKRDYSFDNYEMSLNAFGGELTNKRKFLINDLIRLHTPFSTASLLPTRNISSMYLPNMDDTYMLVSSLLSDKIYQLHIEHNNRVTVLYQRALRLIHDGVKELNDTEITLEQVWDSLLISIPLQVKSFINFAKDVPGLNELNQQDFTTLINNRLFDFFLVKHAPLFINGESYMVLPNNIHYTRALMNQVIGVEMVTAIFDFAKHFNALHFTQKEIALIFPYVLTLHDEIYMDQPTVRNLNEYYMRALFYEFDLNKRDSDFVNKWNQVVSMFPYLNELQAVKIGGLTPPKRSGGRKSI